MLRCQEKIILAERGFDPRTFGCHCEHNWTCLNGYWPFLAWFWPVFEHWGLSF